MVRYTLHAVLALCFLFAVVATVESSLTRPNYESIGCFQDRAERAIAPLEGQDVRLNGVYETRTNAIQKCYHATRERGWKMFAVQNGGWCASSATAEDTYNIYGLSNACNADGKGGPYANQVYFITEIPPEFSTCSRNWRKLGCFKDLLNGQRTLPDQLVNNRDEITSLVFDGPVLDWNRAGDSFHSLACDCAEQTALMGYQVFGLQFYGECWSGAGGEATFDIFGGEEINQCFMAGNDDNNPETLQTCDIESPVECVGNCSTNFVYVLVPEEPPFEGEWSGWQPWEDCDQTCGSGEQSRQRFCANPDPFWYQSVRCLGSNREFRECNLRPCPIDGGFTPFEPVGECSVTCGGGTQHFNRTCTNPEPQFDGRECMGPFSKIEPCNEFLCPIPCNRTLDIAVVLDATQSVGTANFRIAKNFVKTIAYAMQISPTASHMGLIQFHRHPTIEVGFNELDKQFPPVIAQVLNGITFLGSQTRIDLGIGLAATLFTPAEGDRPFAPDVTLVITDGRTHPTSQEYSDVLQPFENQGIMTVAIGVGHNILYSELLEIAQGSSGCVFEVTDFNSLFNRLQDIIDISCIPYQG